MSFVAGAHFRAVRTVSVDITCRFLSLDMQMKRFPDVSVGVRLALRARFASLSLWATLIVIAAAWMAAQFSGRQPATVALDVGFSIVRLALPIVGVLLLQELVSREFERRLFLSSLAYPRSRHWFLLGRISAILLLLFSLLAWLATVLGVTVSLVSKGYTQATPIALDHRYLVTVAFIALDLFVVVAVGSLLAVVASTSSFVLIGTIGFMVVARSFSTVVALLQRESWLVGHPEQYRSYLGFLEHLLPDLAALDVRMIALYGRMELLPLNWANHVVSALVYGIAFVGFSMWSLSRKRFA